MVHLEETKSLWNSQLSKLAGVCVPRMECMLSREAHSPAAPCLSWLTTQ